MLCLLCKDNVNKKITFYNFFFNKLICTECYDQIEFKTQIKYYKNNKIIILFKYNQTLKNIIHLWKIQKDKLALKLIAELIKDHLPKNKIIIYPPSWRVQKEFNHLEKVFNFLNLKFKNIFIKTKPYQQAKLKLDNKQNHILLFSNVPKRFIVFDDIYTSGKTIKKVLDLLNKKRHYKITAVIIATTKNIN